MKFIYRINAGVIVLISMIGTAVSLWAYTEHCNAVRSGSHGNCIQNDCALFNNCNEYCIDSTDDDWWVGQCVSEDDPQIGRRCIQTNEMVVTMRPGTCVGNSCIKGVEGAPYTEDGIWWSKNDGYCP